LLFDYCATCRRCCNVDPGELPLEISLTEAEQKSLGHLCIERQCEHLAITGCTLGDGKPFSCHLYPLAYSPATHSFYYDVDCPLMPTYVTQLADPHSDASRHLAAVSKQIAALAETDRSFLQRNFAVDKGYFELRRLTAAGELDAKGDTSKASPSVPPTVRKGRRVNAVGHQTWTRGNLSVEDRHNGVAYYLPRWDALCPYIDVTEDMLAGAPRPFIVYGLPPEGPYGVAITDVYGLVDTSSSEWRDDLRRARKFRALEKHYRGFNLSETVISPGGLSVADLLTLGGGQFTLAGIDVAGVAGFVDYARTLEVLIIQVHDSAGSLVLTDVSLLLPSRNQVYGSFCQWNRVHRRMSPGIYACLLASRWAERNGFRYYNLGPVGDYDYKALFVTDYEPIYGLALTDPSHPLALDPTSPLNVDFEPWQWNQVYRPAESVMTAAEYRRADASMPVG
jgi:hypothetical protein